MSKISQFDNDKNWLRVSKGNREFIIELCDKYRLSFQDIKQLIDIALDLEAWDEKQLKFYWPETLTIKLKGKELKTHLINSVKESWIKLKTEPTLKLKLILTLN